MFDINDYYKASKIANMLDISTKTLSMWYEWYHNPDIKKPDGTPPLPEYVQQHERGTRYWKKSDIDKLKAFQEWIPKGRNGVMGAVSNKYWKKSREQSNER